MVGEILATAIGATTLSFEILRLARKLRKFAKYMRTARQEFNKLSREMGWFAQLCEQFGDIKSDPGSSEAPSFKDLYDWAKGVLKDLNKLMVEIGMPASGNKTGVLSEAFARVQWYLKRNYVKGLRAMLSVARESMNGFMNLRHIEQLTKILEELKKKLKKGGPPMELSDDIRSMENRIKMKRLMSRETNRSIEEAKGRVSKYENKTKVQGDGEGPSLMPSYNRLFDFVESVELYEKKVLPYRHSGTRSSASSRLGRNTGFERSAHRINGKQSDARVRTPTHRRILSPASQPRRTQSPPHKESSVYNESSSDDSDCDSYSSSPIGHTGSSISRNPNDYIHGAAAGPDHPIHAPSQSPQPQPLRPPMKQTRPNTSTNKRSKDNNPSPSSLTRPSTTPTTPTTPPSPPSNPHPRPKLKTPSPSESIPFQDTKDYVWIQCSDPQALRSSNLRPRTRDEKRLDGDGNRWVRFERMEWEVWARQETERVRRKEKEKKERKEAEELQAWIREMKEEDSSEKDGVAEQPSPFHPVGATPGKYPQSLRERRKRRMRLEEGREGDQGRGK